MLCRPFNRQFGGFFLNGWPKSLYHYRFSKGDYICTSKLVEINPKTNLIKTASGSTYKVIGEGRKASIDYCDFELLRNGFNPEQINALKTATLQH